LPKETRREEATVDACRLLSLAHGLPTPRLEKQRGSKRKMFPGRSAIFVRDVGKIAERVEASNFNRTSIGGM
jgi:hypothetical protein